MAEGREDRRPNSLFLGKFILLLFIIAVKRSRTMENPRPAIGLEEEKLNEIDAKCTSDTPVIVPNFVEYNPKRGRPSGSIDKLKKLLALASEGGKKAILTMGNEFTPAMVTVEHGEVSQSWLIKFKKRI